MNWWEWVFSGIGVLAVTLCIEWLRRRSRPSDAKAAITAKGAKVADSPVASGKDIKQNVTETHHHYYGDAAELEKKPEPPHVQVSSEDRKPHIGYLGTETLCIVEYDNGVFVATEQALPAILIKFSNDAVIGASTRAASVKATIVYRDAGNEILRVMGAWLELATGHAHFEVDSSHKLIVCFILKNELCTLKKYEEVGHRRRWWRADLHTFGSLEKFTALVRLTNTFSGYCYFEGEFEVQKSPLAISVIKTA